jgi:hypothetical protein
LSQNNKIALVLLPAAAAVAVGLVSLRLHFQPPTVPDFAVAGATEPLAVMPGTSFAIELKPRAPVSGAIAARGFLLRGDEVRPWDPPFTVAPDGTVRIAGAVDTLFAGIPAGPWEIAVAVGRPETLPTAPKDVLRASREQAPAEASWRLVRERISLRP